MFRSPDNLPFLTFVSWLLLRVALVAFFGLLALVTVHK